MPGSGAASFAYVCGTFDTRAAELNYLGDLLRAAGLRVRTVDLGTRGDGGRVDVTAAEVAAAHPNGVGAVLGLDDRGAAVGAMAVAFERWLAAQADVGGIIGAGGSGNTALVAPGIRRWWRRPCARYRWACPRSWSRPSRRATAVPYVGSVGAVDMVNFGALDTVPERYRDRNLYVHNPQVTLMRTTAEENAAIGRWIGTRLDACQGQIRFLLPEGGVSLIDAPGKPFHDHAADAALFAGIEAMLRPGPQRRVERLPFAINDPEFAAALVQAFREVAA